MRIDYNPDLIPARNALKDIVHHLEPVAKITREVIEAGVPHGAGQRTKAIVARLYVPNAENPFNVRPDVFELAQGQLSHLAQQPGAQQYAQKTRGLFNTLFDAVRKHGAELSRQ